MSDAPQPKLEDLVFVGFNSRVAALDRYDGHVVWEWKAPRGSGYVALMLDGDRLIASVQGYTYCLEPESGAELWQNPLQGRGVGVPCLTSSRGGMHSALYSLLAAAEAEQQRNAHAANAAGS